MLGVAIRLLTSELGRMVIVACIGAIVATGAYWKGRIDRAAIDRTRELEATVETLKAELASHQRIAAAAREAISRLNEEKAHDDELIGAYEEELRRRKEPACSLTPADVERLRRIGAPPPAPKPPAPSSGLW